MFFTYYDAYVTIGFGKNKRRNFTKEGEAYLCLNGYLSAVGFGSATLQFFGVGFGAVPSMGVVGGVGAVLLGCDVDVEDLYAGVPWFGVEVGFLNC